MKLYYRDGLIFTAIKLTFNNKTIELNNIVVDTGASFCIFEPSVLEEIGISLSKDDEIETFYGVNGVFSYVKMTADNIILDNVTIEKPDFYLGTIDDNIDGLLGLDILIKAKAIVNLNDMEIQFL